MRDVSCRLMELIVDVVRALSQALARLKDPCDQAELSVRL